MFLRFVNRVGITIWFEPYFMLPFIENEEAEFSERFNIGSKQAIASLEVVAPAHGVRSEKGMSFKIRQPQIQVQQFVLAFSLGGEVDEIHREAIEPVAESDGVLSFSVSSELWNQLKTNVGYWWMVLGNSG